MKVKHARAVGAYHPPRPGGPEWEEVVVRLRPREAAALEALAIEYGVAGDAVARVAVLVLLEAAARGRERVAWALFGDAMDAGGGQ